MVSSVNGDLRKLHALHRQLKEVQEQLDKGPRQVRARQQLTQQKQAELEAGRQRHTSLRMLADQKSLQLKSNDAKLSDLRAKLNQAASNREYQSFTGQINADEMSKSVLEDEILETLEKIDLAQKEVKRLEEELVTVKANEARIIAEVAAQEPTLKARIAELQVAVKAAEQFLPGDAAANYRRLVGAYGSEGMAEVVNSTCTSCYVSQTPQQLLQLRTGQILFCKTCGKLLYIGEED